VADTYCERCAEKIESGALRYLLTINVTADFEGSLPNEGDIEDLEAFMAQMDRSDPVKLRNDVFQTRGFLLCPKCKREFMNDPLAQKTPDSNEDPQGGRVH